MPVSSLCSPRLVFPPLSFLPAIPPIFFGFLLIDQYTFWQPSFFFFSFFGGFPPLLWFALTSEHPLTFPRLLHFSVAGSDFPPQKAFFPSASVAPLSTSSVGSRSRAREAVPQCVFSHSAFLFFLLFFLASSISCGPLLPLRGRSLLLYVFFPFPFCYQDFDRPLVPRFTIVPFCPPTACGPVFFRAFFCLHFLFCLI